MGFVRVCSQVLLFDVCAFGGQFFAFDDQRRALSANVQSTTCCGVAVIFLLL
jgi:hypothetical protein